MKRLNTLLLVNESKKQIASFRLNEIVRVAYGKMKDFHTDSNIFANGHKKMKVQYRYVLQMVLQ